MEEGNVSEMLSPEVGQQLLLYLLLSQDERIGPFTVRDREIVVLCARGLTTPEIASVLSLPVNTVKTQMEQILDNLMAMDQVENAMLGVLAGSAE